MCLYFRYEPKPKSSECGTLPTLASDNGRPAHRPPQGSQSGLLGATDGWHSASRGNPQVPQPLTIPTSVCPEHFVILIFDYRSWQIPWQSLLFLLFLKPAGYDSNPHKTCRRAYLHLHSFPPNRLQCVDSSRQQSSR